MFDEPVGDWPEWVLSHARRGRAGRVLRSACCGSGWPAGNVASLVVELGSAAPDGELRDALARALGDPTLQVAYALPGRAARRPPRATPSTCPTAPSAP